MMDRVLGPNRVNFANKGVCHRVSVQGVESLWSDCRFIPADWGS